MLRRTIVLLVVATVMVGLSGLAWCATPTTAPAKDIVDTAVAAGQFKTLAKLLEAAGLVETLKGKGPFTVFAPTDDAFAKLPKETLEDLLKPESKEKLKAILTYHVAAGTMVAADVVKAKSIKTVNGKEITVTVKDKDVMVDNAKVAKADVTASNGVIHVIDTVLIPPAK
jgi:transforming growth factor-beta-induced protein